MNTEAREKLKEIISSSLYERKPVLPLTPRELAVLYVMLANGNPGMSPKEIEDEISHIFRIPRHKVFPVRYQLYNLLKKGFVRRERHKNIYVYYVLPEAMELIDILHMLLELAEFKNVREKIREELRKKD